MRLAKTAAPRDWPRHRGPELVHYWLVGLALIVRFQNIVHLPKFAIVGLEFALLIPFCILNWDRRAVLFLDSRAIRRDVIIGLALGIGWAVLEMGWNGLNGISSPLHFENLPYVFLALIYVGWASAAYEELLFRSAVMGRLNLICTNKMAVVFAQGLLFLAAHGSRYFRAGEWHSAVAVGAFGLVLGLVALRRGSILPTFIAHAIANCYGVLFLEPMAVLDRILTTWLR